MIRSNVEVAYPFSRERFEAVNMIVLKQDSWSRYQKHNWWPMQPVEPLWPPYNELEFGLRSDADAQELLRSRLKSTLEGYRIWTVESGLLTHVCGCCYCQQGMHFLKNSKYFSV